jgi:hypothetical protein
MGELVYANFGESRLLGKSPLGKALGRSVRWVEERTAEGMPSSLKGRRRVYKETDCRNWLAAHGKTSKRSANG